MLPSLLPETITRWKSLFLQTSHFCLVFLGANWGGRKCSHSFQTWNKLESWKQAHNADFLSSDSKSFKKSLVNTMAAHEVTCALGCTSTEDSRDLWSSAGGLWNESNLMQTWTHWPGRAMPRTVSF